MTFGYTIVYVPDVSASLSFFSQAFGFQEKFLHESGDYGELETGETTLAFASHELGHQNFPNGFSKVAENPLPIGIELAFVTTEVESAHQKALEMGAIEITPPQKKPWGQLVSYLRCPAGNLIELCTPISPQ